MNKLTRISATVASSLALVAGFSGVAGATSMTTIHNSGNLAKNTVKSTSTTTTKVHNDTSVGMLNFNGQLAASGDATVKDNHNVDSVATGNASNANTTSASVTVDNSASSTAALNAAPAAPAAPDNVTIHNSGNSADNTVSSTSTVTTNVDNDTHVLAGNLNLQGAFSGDATVKDNHNVGSVSTGNASNTNSTTMTVNVTN